MCCKHGDSKFKLCIPVLTVPCKILVTLELSNPLIFNRVPVRPVVNNRGPPLDDDLETEAAVLANFDFLQNDVEDEEDNDDELDDGGSADDESEDRDDIRLGRRMGKRAKGRLNYC